MTTPDTQATARLPWDVADPYPYYEARRREGRGPLTVPARFIT